METIKQTIAQNLGGPAHAAVSESQQFALEQVPSLTGKVAVITGGSQGIGYGCSHTMLTHDIKKVFILSMSKDVVDGAVNAVSEEMGQETADRIVWLQCDLSDWKQVKQTADKIASQTDRIDIMINSMPGTAFGGFQILMCLLRRCSRDHDLPAHRIRCRPPRQYFRSSYPLAGQFD